MLEDNQDNLKKLDDGNFSSEESDESGTRAIDYTITYIEIVTPPTKINYLVGETFNPAGMVVRAHYSNGNSANVTLYQYSPTTPLTLGTTYVTISFLGKSANQSITVTAANCLMIEHNPTKTTYQVGDYFEPYGLVVRKYDSNGNGVLVYDYSFSPSTPLTSSNNQITISHSGFTKTISIVVNNVPTTGYFPTQFSKNSLIGNNPYYNLFDLSALFLTNPVSVSRDSYILSFNLAYQSRMKGRLSNLCKGLPQRFKSNFHQFLLQDGLDENSNPIYKYIDADGFIHSFYKIKERLYYSRQTGLYLFFFAQNDDDYAKIVDADKNELYFSEDSYLIKIVSGKDSSNIKHIVYNSNGFITKVYDNRVSNTEISFSYSNSLLSTVTFKYLGSVVKTLAFTYSSNSFGALLTNISENANNHTRDLYSFSYNSNYGTFDRVQYITDYLNQVVYLLSTAFYYSLNDYYATDVKKGHFINNSFIAKEYLNFVTATPRSDTYKSVEEVTLNNQNNQYITYFLTKAGVVASNFECNGIFSTTYKTLYKESGEYIDINASGPTTINSHGFKDVTAPISIGASSNIVSKYKHFVLRMYVKLSNPSCKRIKASLTSPLTSSSTINIDEDQYGKIIPLEIPFTKKISGYALAVVLSFKDENDNNVEVSISDLYLDKKERTKLVFHNGDYSFDDLVTLKIYNHPYDPPLTFDNSSYPYFTEQDLFNTLLLNYRHNDLYCGGYPTLFLSNAKSFTTYSVAFAGADSNDVNFLLSTQLDSGSYPWYFETRSPDNKTVSKTYYRFYSSYYEIKKETIYDNNDYTLQTEIRRYTYSNTLIKVTTSHLDNNQTISSETDYEYYANGELKKVTSSSGNEEIVLYDTTQNAYGYITRKTSGRKSVNISYQGYLEHAIIRNGFNSNGIYSSLFGKIVSYDNYKEEISSVAFLNDDVNMATNGQINDYLYNEFYYRLNNGPLYKLINDYENDSIDFTRYDGNYYRYVLTIHQDDDYDEIVYSITTSADLTITNNYDQYKRVINQKVNNVTKATFTYEDNIESASIANVKSIADKYIDSNGIVTSITYDPYDSSVIGINFNNGAFTVDIDAISKIVTYGFDSDNSQGLVIARSNDKTVNDITNYHTINPIIRTFSTKKDGFNRVSKNTYEIITSYWLVSQISYANNSSLISEFSFGSSCGDLNISELYYKDIYNYDGFGNLNSVSGAFKGYNEDVLSYSISYTYDGFSRLIAEFNSQVSEYNRTYSYSNDGKMEYFGNTYLSYNDEGQLEYFGSIQFTYDQYGNRLTKENDQYNYERGKLLSSLTINNNTTTFKYDYLGRRYQKISGGVTTTYYYHDDKLIAETRSNGIKLIFLYRDNEIVGFCKCESSEERFFYYIKNPFGLIVGIINESDQVLASYVYDAWGNHTILNPYNYQSDIGEINPIRYKGYYYDEETKLYYLKSRYYDPSIGQFISPDDYSYLKINNVSGYYLYAYCNNNPVMYVDEDGHSAILAILIATGIAALSIAVETAVGVAAYWWWDAFDGIDSIKGDYKNGITIENGFLLPGFFSKIAFLYTAQSQGKLSSNRSIIGQAIEWLGHNAISYAAFLPLLVDDPLKELVIRVTAAYLFIKHTKDVDLENSLLWFMFWEHLL